MNKKVMSMFEHLNGCKGVKETVSFFIPVKVKGNICDTAFLYSNTPQVKKGRPSAKVVFDYPTGTLLEYTNARVSDFIDTDSHPFDKQLDYSVPFATKLSEQSELVNRANELYSSVRELAYKTDISTEERKTIVDYQDILIKSTPKELMPFYRALSPEYFEWVESLN